MILALHCRRESLDQGGFYKFGTSRDIDQNMQYWGAAYKDAPSLHNLVFSSYATPEQEIFMSSSITTNPLGSGHHPVHALSIPLPELPDAAKHPMFYVAVYAVIGLGGGVLGLIAVSTQYLAALKASRKLFKQLLETVVHATMRWFDTTPTVGDV
jgi:hypothetical protein